MGELNTFNIKCVISYNCKIMLHKTGFHEALSDQPKAKELFFLYVFLCVHKQHLEGAGSH